MKNDSIRRGNFEKRQKSGQISPNPARSQSFLARSWLDLAKSRRIQLKSSQRKLKTRQIYPKKSQNSPEKRQVGRIRFLGFERRRFDLRPVDLGFWRMKSVADCHSSRFGWRWVGFGRRQRVGQFRRVLGQPQLSASNGLFDNWMCPMHSFMDFSRRKFIYSSLQAMLINNFLIKSTDYINPYMVSNKPLELGLIILHLSCQARLAQDCLRRKATKGLFTSKYHLNNIYLFLFNFKSIIKSYLLI